MVPKNIEIKLRFLERKKMEGLILVLSVAYIVFLLTIIVLYVRKKEKNTKLFEAKINVLREILNYPSLKGGDS